MRDYDTYKYRRERMHYIIFHMLRVNQSLKLWSASQLLHTTSFITNLQSFVVFHNYLVTILWDFVTVS